MDHFTIEQIGEKFQTYWFRGERPSVEKFLEQNNLEPTDKLVEYLSNLQSVLSREDLCSDSTRHLMLENGDADPESFDASQDLTTPYARSNGPGETIKSIGKYQIQKQLGQGGQSIVYQAYDQNLDRQVALKVSRYSVDDPHSMELMRDEGRILAKLNHQTLAKVMEFDFQAGQPYLVTELIDGPNLLQVVADVGMHWRDTVNIMIQIAKGVEYLNSNGVIHRDLKPANIVLRKNGDPIIIDFGLAANQIGISNNDMTTSDIEGTIAYMAPEQANEGQSITRHTDVYGLGGTLFYLLAGRPPKSGNTFKIGLKNAKENVVEADRLNQLSIPTRLKQICKKALQTDKSARHSTAGELADDLTNLLFIQNALSFAKYFILATMLIVFAVVALNWNSTSDVPSEQESKLAKEIPQIIDYQVQFEPRNGDLAGTGKYALGQIDQRPKVNDGVSLTINLKSKAYCYLIAYNPPDGKLQLHWPEEASTPVTESNSQIHFPATDAKRLLLNDGMGQQVFVLLTSSEPLPSFSEFASIHSIPETFSFAGHRGLWFFDGKKLIEKKFPSTRGDVVDVFEGKKLQELVDHFRTVAPNITYFAVSFPVEEMEN